MRRELRRFTLLVFLASFLVPPSVVAAPSALPGSPVGAAQAGPRVTPVAFRGDVRRLPTVASTRREAPELTGPMRRPSGGAVTASRLPSANLVTGSMPVPAQSFEGLSNNAACTGGPCGGGYPPDPNGDVGPNHYIQTVNTSIGIFTRTGTSLARFTFNSLWAGNGVGTPCEASNNGDPVVVYDPMGDRWIVSDIAWTDFTNGPYYYCIAVSMTGDPVAGGWWLYAVRADDAAHPWLNDYPKMAIWPDALYITANEFLTNPSPQYQGVRVWALSRSDLESGAPLRQIVYDQADPNKFTMLPANLRGVAPAAGTPAYLVVQDANLYGYYVYRFHPDFATPASSTFTGPTIASQETYSVPASRIVPQPGTSTRLDSLGDRLMAQLQYRKIGNSESLWLSHTVRTSSSSPTAIQWAQIDVSGGAVNTTPLQQQTFTSGADTLFRWVPSIAVDSGGNAALGYSASNASTFPGIRVAGRLASDPASQMAQAERTLMAGGASQIVDCGGGSCSRWGDYSAMSVDPVDDCTFWYTTEYYAAGDTANWHTRIASFKFPGCVGVVSDLTVTKTHVGVFKRGQVGASYTITVRNSGSGPTTGTVSMTDALPSGLTATALAGPGWSCTLATVSCTRAGSVLAGASYPAITLTVNVASTAPASVVNTATVAGGGETNLSNNTANDPTTIAPVRRPPADFNGDGKTDVSVFRPSDGTWYINGVTNTQWGTSGDIPVPGDYNGDGKTDIAVFRPSDGTWYINGQTNVQWGTSGDIPVPGDYNGDGITDIAVFRPSTGTWYVRGGTSVQWGTGGDIPVPGDYNGDGTTDKAVFRPSTGTWYVLGGTNTQWGTSGDIPVPGDYNGDGKTDVAVFRPGDGVWYVNGVTNTQWGTSGDIPVPGDYNGDGITDKAVFRPSDGVWYINGGTNTQWGTSGDIPLPLPAAIRQVFFP